MTSMQGIATPSSATITIRTRAKRKQLRRFAAWAALNGHFEAVQAVGKLVVTIGYGAQYEAKLPTPEGDAFLAAVFALDEQFPGAAWVRTKLLGPGDVDYEVELELQAPILECRPVLFEPQAPPFEAAIAELLAPPAAPLVELLTEQLGDVDDAAVIRKCVKCSQAKLLASEYLKSTDHVCKVCNRIYFDRALESAAQLPAAKRGKQEIVLPVSLGRPLRSCAKCGEPLGARWKSDLCKQCLSICPECQEPRKGPHDERCRVCARKLRLPRGPLPMQRSRGRMRYEDLQFATFTSRARDGRYRTGLIVGGKHKYVYRDTWVYEQVNGPIPMGYWIKHISGDLGDDGISNLSCVPRPKPHAKKGASSCMMNGVPTFADSVFRRP